MLYEQQPLNTDASSTLLPLKTAQTHTAPTQLPGGRVDLQFVPLPCCFSERYDSSVLLSDSQPYLGRCCCPLSTLQALLRGRFQPPSDHMFVVWLSTPARQQHNSKQQPLNNTLCRNRTVCHVSCVPHRLGQRGIAVHVLAGSRLAGVHSACLAASCSLAGVASCCHPRGGKEMGIAHACEVPRTM